MTTEEERKRLKAVHHVVHEYANFVSSAEMVLTGKDVEGQLFRPPVNTHLSHAFYLNCRKLADFFENKKFAGDVKAAHFVDGYAANLRVFSRWRDRIDKQLAHITYKRDSGSREIKRRTQELIYRELQHSWRRFRRQLPRTYADEFAKQIRQRTAPGRAGDLSEFRNYDLD